MENLNNVPSTGTFGNSVQKINSNFDLIVNAINSLEYQTTRSKGILNYGTNPATVFPNAVAGDWCMILSEGNVFPATIKTYNGSTWSGSGTWNPDGVDLTGYAKTTDMTTAIANSLAQATARMGYGEATASNNAYSVTITGYTLPTKGGVVRIKMPTSATGAATLNITDTGAKTLWYNGAAVSSQNTWEAGEIISVFFDGTKYMASNSQGGGGNASKIKYDNSQSGLASANVQGAVDEVSNKAIQSYALTHFNNFIPVSCWANKKYDGVGLYTGNGYYSFGLTALEGGTKILVKASLPIERLRSYISDAYITKRQSAGDITVDSLPLVISSTLSLITVPSNRTNIGISFYGNPSQVSYCICGDDFNLTDYSDEKIREIENVFDGLLFPLSEKEDIQYTSPSSYMYIDVATLYWKTGSASTTCVFAKVSPSSRYLIQAPNSSSISFFWLKNTSAANNTFPNFAGGGMPRDFYVTAGNSITIDTPEDCEYLYFLIHSRLNRTKPAYIIKRTNDVNVIKGVSSVGEKALSISNGVSKAVELETIASYGLFINVGTNKWISNTSNNYSVIYHVIGGSKIKITASQSGQSEYIMLKSLGSAAGDDVEYAKGVSGGTRVPTGSTIDADVPSDAKYVYFLVHSSLSLYAPTYVEGMCVNNGIDAIDFIGDSMTQRNVSATWPRGFYAGKVMQYLNIDGLNMGAGGENAATILGRCNGIPYKLASDVTIPADTTNVQIYLTNIYGQFILPILQRYTSHTIVIDGIEGILTTTQTNPAAMSADYFFKRKVSGSSYNAKAGDDVFVKDFKATLNPNRAKIIWVGENGGFDTNSSYRYGGDITSADDRARLIDMIKAYIDVCGCEYYMVLSAPRRTNNDLESDFAKAFGNRYFNVRMYMVNHGIDDAIALGYLSASSYPTQQDITDMANGVVPSSLRADETHFTENGFYTMAYALSIKLKEVWNL